MTTSIEANNNEVICPSCCTQFRAIPVNVQRLLIGAGISPPFTQEEAQTVEPVAIYHGKCIIDCGDGGHQDITMLKMVAAGSKLYTRPAPAPTGERAALIAGLLESADVIEADDRSFIADEIRQAADMLAADAQEIARLTSSVAHWSQACVDFRNQRDELKTAHALPVATSDEWLANCPQSVRDFANRIKKEMQQVAVPQTCKLCGSDEPLYGPCGGGRKNPDALCYEAAPQPPQD